MSLVNKMLRDLDARRAGAADRGALPAAVTSLAENPTFSRTRLAALLVLATLAAAGAASFMGYLPSLEIPALPAVKAPPVAPAAKPATVDAQAPALAAAAPAVPEPTASGVSPAPTSGVPDRLLLKLDADLDRLPDPGKRAAPEKPEAPKRDKPSAPIKPAVAPKPAAAAVPPVDGHIEKQERFATADEKAEAEFRRGQAAQRQGAREEAVTRYRTALAEQVEHVGARRALAALLTELRRTDEAEDTLRRGMAALPAQAYWPMALARLKVERGEVPAALDILLKQGAAGDANAEFQGFAAALLNRQTRYKEAAERYEAATRLAPNEARWWAGLGIALEASGRSTEARAAYQRARSLPGLPADLAAHVEQRLR